MIYEGRCLVKLKGTKMLASFAFMLIKIKIQYCKPDLPYTFKKRFLCTSCACFLVSCVIQCHTVVIQCHKTLRSFGSSRKIGACFHEEKLPLVERLPSSRFISFFMKIYMTKVVPASRPIIGPCQFHPCSTCADFLPLP